MIYKKNIPAKTVIKILLLKYAVINVGRAAIKKLLLNERFNEPSVIKIAGAKRDARIAGPTNFKILII